MSLSLTLAALWAVVANVLAMIPSRDNQWTRAYGLMAVGAPLLGFVFYQHGIWVALVVLCAGASLLRWPVMYLGRWLRGLVLRARA